MRNQRSAILLCGLICLMGAAGCSTPTSVAKMEGQGKRRVFQAGYGTVWEAAQVAVRMDDFSILEANPRTGYISARRAIGDTTFGDNLGLWVRKKGVDKTEVEIIVRPIGPPVFLTPNPMRQILKTMAGTLPT